MGEQYAWASPDVISGMTLSQIWMYLSAPHDGPPANAFKNDAAREAFITKVREKHEGRE